MDEMIEKRVAVSNTVLRLEMLINVLSDDLNLFEKVGREGCSCLEFDLEKQYKRRVLEQLVAIKKELICSL